MEAVAAFGSSPPPMHPPISTPTGEVGVVAALFDTAAAGVEAASGLSLERLFLKWWYCCLEECEPPTVAEGYLELIPH